MSETDDTDELLLMTPHIEENLQESFIPYYQIVDKLITQVSKLKNRITSIEQSSDVSLSSLTNSIETFPIMHSSDSGTCRRCYSYESLPQHYETGKSTFQCLSTQSTPQKPRNKLILKSPPRSPKYVEDFRYYKRPLRHRSGVPRTAIDLEKNDDAFKKQSVMDESNIINEIDDFLCNVKSTGELGAARNLNFDQITYECLGRDKALQDVQQILKEMDEQEEKIKSMHGVDIDSATYDCSNKSNEDSWKNGRDTLSITSTDSSLAEKSTVLCGPCQKQDKEKINIVDSKKENHTNQNKCDLDFDKKHSKKPDSNVGMSSSNLSIFSKTKPTNCDIHSNAKDVLSLHKKMLEETNVSEKTNSHQNGRIPSKQSISQSLRAVSLLDLWSSENNVAEKSTDKCVQKLQEEKLRRTHCEELIQQLQNKILEQQEKLAVAIQVDEAKDNAIVRFHDAWDKVTTKFKEVIKEKNQLDNDLANSLEQNKRLTEEFEERVEFHRRETNQALLIAKEHRNQLDIVEKKCNELMAENESMKTANKELRDKIAKEEERNKQLSNILANKEIELDESKNLMLQAKKEVAQCQQAVEMCQKDFSTIKSEYELAQDELKNERLNVSQLHEQNKAIYEELETQRKNEKILVENLQEVQGKLESNKRELRDFYQGQVELLVQTKLKEFQSQLDQAEEKMKRELSKKETEIAKAAAMHIQQITVKHDLEISLLEQKHQEEMQLRQVRVAQMEQRIQELQLKLDRQQDRRSDLIRQLQKVMEAQWAEALRIINQSRSGGANSPAASGRCDDSASTIDQQLQSLHSKSYQNMEALLLDVDAHLNEGDTRAPAPNRRQQRQNYEITANHVVETRIGGAVGGGHHHHRHRNKRGGVRSRGMRNEDENEGLQRYIDLLLHKQADDVSSKFERPKSPKFSVDQSQQEKSSWQQNTNFPQGADGEFPEKDRHRRESEKRKTSWR